MKEPKNRVRTDDAQTSDNFFTSDQLLRRYLKKMIPGEVLEYLSPKLEHLGEEAAIRMDALSQRADKESPRLKKRDKWGEKVDEIVFDHAYWELLDIAAESEMFHLKYDPELREQFAGNRHKMGYAAGQLYAMSELGQYCPLCMTDGAAHLVDRFADAADRKRLLPKLSSKKGSELYTGAMYLTEKSGGSDVGRNLTRAEQAEDGTYRLNGEKWFCSNANAQVMMVLARTGEMEEGTRGLSLFLVEKYLEDGSRNPMEIIRLKDKLGVRSMATAEVRLTDTVGKRLGEEGKGFKVMAEMINISRIYNSLAALAGGRRAVIEAYQYLNHRIIFEKRGIEHALIREKFHELGSLHLGNFLLVWRAIRAMDNAETGDEQEEAMLRVLTPMAKWWSAEHSVYMAREAMELMGGNGYIEDFILPKLFRDVNVLPIWEGSGNVIVLDILRALQKSKGMNLLLAEIQKQFDAYDGPCELPETELNRAAELLAELSEMDRDSCEATAKPLFERIISLLQMALMIEFRDEATEEMVDLALGWYSDRFTNELSKRTPPTPEEIAALMGWEFG